jgi:hypothetical protein
VSLDRHRDGARDRGHRPYTEAFRAQRQLYERIGFSIAQAPRR